MGADCVENCEKIAAAPESNADLFARLKALRLQLAQRENVPAYIIFSNATLANMAAKRPEIVEEFLQVSGIGTVKSQRYSEIFLKEIRGWKGEQA